VAKRDRLEAGRAIGRGTRGDTERDDAEDGGHCCCLAVHASHEGCPFCVALGGGGGQGGAQVWDVGVLEECSLRVNANTALLPLSLRPPRSFFMKRRNLGLMSINIHIMVGPFVAATTRS
jgi:hypothetical protein